MMALPGHRVRESVPGSFLDSFEIRDIAVHFPTDRE